MSDVGFASELFGGCWKQRFLILWSTEEPIGHVVLTVLGVGPDAEGSLCMNVQGDGVGPLGTCMVLGLKSDGASELFNHTAFGSKIPGGSDAASLSRMELLLKEIIGGEAIGWTSVGPLGLDRNARVVRAGCRISGMLGSILSWIMSRQVCTSWVPLHPILFTLCCPIYCHILAISRGQGFVSC